MVLLNEKGLDLIIAILMCSVILFAILMVPLVMPFAMLVNSMMPLNMLMRYMVPLTMLLRTMVPLALLMRPMVPFAMSIHFPSRVWAIILATAIPVAALVALYHRLVFLALGLLLIPS